MTAPTQYHELLEVLVAEDARCLELRADELSALKPRQPGPAPSRFPNAERVARLRGAATHLRAMSAVRLRARYKI